MARKIAFYNTEQQVIDVIAQLEQANFVSGELQIIAKDWEHSRRIEAQTDVHVDELQELADAGSPYFDGSHSIGEPDTPVLFTGVGGGFWLNGISPIGVRPVALGYSEDEYTRALKAFEMDDHSTQACVEAVRSGQYAVIVETDDTMLFIDKEDGADLSRLSVAEGIFRSSGALSILSGK